MRRFLFYCFFHIDSEDAMFPRSPFITVRFCLLCDNAFIPVGYLVGFRLRNAGKSIIIVRVSGCLFVLNLSVLEVRSFCLLAHFLMDFSVLAGLLRYRVTLNVDQILNI